MKSIHRFLKKNLGVKERSHCYLIASNTGGEDAKGLINTTYSTQSRFIGLNRISQHVDDVTFWYPLTTVRLAGGGVISRQIIFMVGSKLNPALVLTALTRLGWQCEPG